MLQLPLGFFVALLLDKTKGWVQRIARAIIILPICIPPIVATMIWKVALGPTQGVINYLLQSIGLQAVDWLSDPSVALTTVVLIDTWIWTPFVVIVIWGGLRSLPKRPYEAAMVDGASPWFIFRELTLPLMRPYIMIALLFRLCDSLNTYDIIYGTTKGGPIHVTRTVAVYASEVANWWHLGYGAAMALVSYFMTYFIAKRLVRLWPR
jgi:multiple sugar transport system permease protein